MHEPSTHAPAALGTEPTILLVAEGERLAPALAERLAQHGVQVELATPAAVVTTAFVGAPDVVVLAGQAAIDGGEAILARLAEQPATSALPVILIADEGTVTGRLEAFRHGVVAVIERSASADEMARRIADIARELPERAGETAGPLEAASLDDVVALFAQSLRSGVLAVTGKPGGPSAQVVLRPDRPLTNAIAELVERLKPMLAHGDHALRYEFHESPPSRISSIDLDDDEVRPRASLAGVRLLVIQANAARADLLAQELRAAGGTVAVADGSGAGLEFAHDLGPEVVVMDGAGVDSWALEALRAIRRDARLRTASLLVLEADQLWQDPRRPNLALLAAKVEDLLAPDKDLEARVRADASVDVRLDVLGPIRLLRTLVRTELGLGVSIMHPRLHAHVDLADGLVVGATARLPTSTRALVEGPAALASFLALATGRVHIAHAATPKAANIMAPLDAALAAATRETPLVSASLPPPAPSSGTHARPPTAARAAPSTSPSPSGGELPVLVERLEELVQHLRASVPAPGPAPTTPSAVAVAAPDASGFGDEPTSAYSPQVMEQLRRRVRRSSAGLRAVEPRGAVGAVEPTTGVVPAKPGPPGPTARPAHSPGTGALGASAKAAPAAPRSKTLVFGAVAAAVPTRVGIPSPAARPAPAAPGAPAARAAPLAPAGPAAGARPATPARTAGAAPAAPALRTAPAVAAALAAPGTLAATAFAPATPGAIAATAPATALAPATPGASAPTAPATALAPATPGPSAATALGTAAPATRAAPAAAAAAPAAVAQKVAPDRPAGPAPATRLRRSATLVGIPSPVAAARPKDDAPLAASADDAAARRAAIAVALAPPRTPVATDAPDVHELAGSDTAVAAVPLEPDDDAHTAHRASEPATAVDVALPEEIVELGADEPDEPVDAPSPPSLAAHAASPPHPLAAHAASPPHALATPPHPLAPIALATPPHSLASHAATPPIALPPAMPPATPMAPPAMQAAVLAPAAPTSTRRPAWRYAAFALLALAGVLGAVGAFLALGSRSSAPAGGTTVAIDAPAMPGATGIGVPTGVAAPSSAPTAATTPATTGGGVPSAAPGAVPPTGLAAVAPPLPEAPPPTAEPPPTAGPPPVATAPAGLGPRLPLGPADPIEGLEADFDLARLGVTPGEPPPSRGALNRRVSRLLADAYRFRSRSDFTRAEEAYRSILSMDPDNPRATAGLALVNGDRGDVLPALLFAQRLTRLRPEYANNFVLLGDRYLAAGDPAAARRAFEHALELEPDHRGARERIAALP